MTHSKRDREIDRERERDGESIYKGGAGRPRGGSRRGSRVEQQGDACESERGGGRRRA
jgi:hypothetical protein